MNISKKRVRLMTFILVAGTSYFGTLQAASRTLPRSRSLDFVKIEPIKILNSTPHDILVHLFKSYPTYRQDTALIIGSHDNMPIPHTVTAFMVIYHTSARKSFVALAPGMEVHISSTPEAPLLHEEHKETK